MKKWVIKNHIWSVLVFVLTCLIVYYLLNRFNPSEDIIEWIILLGGLMVVFIPVMLVYEWEEDKSREVYEKDKK